MTDIPEIRKRAFESFAVAYIRWFDAVEWEDAEDVWLHYVNAKDQPHRGDCTKQPHTCNRCVYEEVSDFANRVVKMLSEPVVDSARKG